MRFITCLIAVVTIASISAFLAGVAIENINGYQHTLETHLESLEQ